LLKQSRIRFANYRTTKRLRIAQLEYFPQLVRSNLGLQSNHLLDLEGLKALLEIELLERVKV
jgi:hypothetical protein